MQNLDLNKRRVWVSLSRLLIAYSLDSYQAIKETMKKNVFKSVIALAALTLGSNALADGFSASLIVPFSPGNPSYFSVGGSLGYSLEVVPFLTVNTGLSVTYLSSSTGNNLSYLSADIGAEYLYGLSKTSDLKIDLPVGAGVFLIAPISNSQNVQPISSRFGGGVYAGVDIQYLSSSMLKVTGSGQFSINFGGSAGVGFSLSGQVGLNYYPTESFQVYGGLSLYSSVYTQSSLYGSYRVYGGVSYLITEPFQLSASFSVSDGDYSLGTGLNYSFTPSFGLGIYASYGNSFTTPSNNANFTIGLQLSFVENPTPRVTSAQFRP
jgi:hypothetical protein